MSSCTNTFTWNANDYIYTNVYGNEDETGVGSVSVIADASHNSCSPLMTKVIIHVNFYPMDDETEFLSKQITISSTYQNNTRGSFSFTMNNVQPKDSNESNNGLSKETIMEGVIESACGLYHDFSNRKFTIDFKETGERIVQII